jgi:two-component sensor histidine kinase
MQSFLLEPFVCSSNMQPEVASVFITEELARRRESRTGAFRDVLPFRELTKQVVDSPARVLPLLVDTALELCDAVSGGISLYEPEPAPGVFRWHHLRGDLERFTGATTPRHFSPCGITLDSRAPTLVQRPERVYSWLQDAKVSLPECLLVPLYLGADEPLGTLWIVSEAEGQFDARHADALADLAGFAGLALRMAADQRKLKTVLDTQQLLTQEMAHRLKNLLAVVQALMNMAARRSTTAADLTKKMTPALEALAAAQSVTSSTRAEAGSSAKLGEVLQLVLAPYMHASITLDGPKLDLTSQAVNVVALVLHELATNSTKYGALSAPEGTVSVEWRPDTTDVLIVWTERSGPQITGTPRIAGFGTFLATKSVAALGGTISPHWQPQGLSVQIKLPIAHLVGQPG